MPDRISPRITPALAAALTTLSIFAGPAAAQDKAERKGVVINQPKGYMQAPLQELRGIMFLNEKKPAGIFATFPNDGETADALRERLRSLFAKMFIKDKDATLTWESKALPLHAGDAKASAQTAVSGQMEVQFVSYERATSEGLLVYGYFAMRHRPGKDSDAKFLDEQGKGVKEFDQFWQSFVHG